MELITVITVCRNVGEQLQYTIDNIRSQNYPDIEYIVIDGASTDDTIDVIKRNESKIDKWISEPDAGIYDAMNKGLRLATGEWVSFMNVGDSFADENVIRDVFSQPVNSSVKLIGGNTCNFFPDGHTEIHYAEPINNIKYNLIFSHQACFTKREIIPGKGSFQFDTDYTYAADYKLFNSIYYKFGENAILLINRIIANYKQEDSASLLNYRKTKREYLKIQASHPNLRWAKELLKFVLLK